jgi:hypothetical protein
MFPARMFPSSLRTKPGKDPANELAGFAVRRQAVVAPGVCAADVRVGSRGASRLVRSRRDPRRRGDHAAGLLPAEQGEWGGVPPRLSACDVGGVSRSARGRVCLLRGRLRDPALRQSDQRGAQDPARVPTRGDDALSRVPIALAARRAVLHAGRGPREGRRGRRGRLLPAQSLLSADLLDRRPGLSLPQRHRNLLLREPALPNRPVLPAPASGIKTDRILRPLREFLWTC